MLTTEQIEFIQKLIGVIEGSQRGEGEIRITIKHRHPCLVHATETYQLPYVPVDVCEKETPAAD